MKTNTAALAALLTLASTAPAFAGVVIDDFGVDPITTYGFATVYTDQTYPAGGVTQTSISGTILGGSRDISAKIVNAVGYPGDNSYIALGVFNSVPFGTHVADLEIGYAGEGDFKLVYDGAGVGGAAAGLNYNLAATGNEIDIGVYYAAAITGQPGSFTPMMLTLTDHNGNSATVTQNATNGYGQSYAFAFSAFAAANGAFDLTHVDSISLDVDLNQASGLTSFLQISGLRTSGEAYTPTNGGNNPAVPEPASWTILAAGLVGVALRRRHKKEA